MTQAEKEAAKAAKQAEKEAAKAAKQAEKEAAKAQIDSDDIIVGDPQVLRPVELPLVVKLPEGKDWKNTEQAEYAKTLNGYAYKNPKKWAKKKDLLISRLKEIGEDPSKFNMYRGESEVEQAGKVGFKNTLIEQ